MYPGSSCPTLSPNARACTHSCPSASREPIAIDRSHRRIARRLARAMSSNAMRDARFCWAGRFCKRLWPFLVAKAVCSTKTAPTQHNDGVNCDQLVRLLEPIAQPTPVFRPFFARSPKVLTKRFTWHPKTSRSCRKAEKMMVGSLQFARLQHLPLHRKPLVGRRERGGRTCYVNPAPRGRRFRRE